MRIVPTPVLLIVLALGARLASAQSPTASPASFVGAWRFDVTPTSGINMPTTRGTITITPRRDSLDARIEWTPSTEGRTSPTQTLRGRATGDSVVFVTEVEGAVAADARSASVRPVISWHFSRREDALVGLITVEIPGVSIPVEPMPVRAVPQLPPTEPTG